MHYTLKILCDFFALCLHVQIGNLGLVSAGQIPHMDGSRPSVASERRSFFFRTFFFLSDFGGVQEMKCVSRMRAQHGRRGFSLVELVVVILVLGIIAAIAAPKMFNTAGDARTNTTKTNLTVLRDALELYKAQNEAYPAAASITTDLEDFIRGNFPAPQVGANKGNATVATSTDDPIAGAAGTEGWIYNATSGEIRVNDASYLTW